MDVDVVVIGAGAVGLACALELGRVGQRVVVVERNGAIGLETSSRNSGVIHAGIYDPPGFAKARLCVEGRALLYARCARDAIPHRRTGKLIVAHDDADVAILESLLARGRDNGAGELRMIDGAEVQRREPRVRAAAALVSPQTGIVDTHALCVSYAAEAKARGVEIALRTTVTGLEPTRGWDVETVGPGGSRFTLRASRIVNAAGLRAADVARMAGLTVPAARFCKGDYFALRGRPVSRLVYPVPTAGGLGIHLTVDLAGSVRAGPDTAWVEAPRYDVCADKASAFAEALRRFLPDVEATDLSPDYAGVRPKLHGPGEPKADFDIRVHDSTAVHLLGIESPGLTASEAIGRHVARTLR